MKNYYLNFQFIRDAKLVFVIPNIEKIEGKNGLDEKLLEIFKASREKNVPIFFGLNKFKLGQISRKKYSCISILCIINVEGFEHELEDLIKSGIILKNKFYEKYNDKKEMFLDNKFVEIEKFK